MHILVVVLLIQGIYDVYYDLFCHPNQRDKQDDFFMPRQHNVFAEVGQNLLKSVFSKFVGISQRQFIVDWVWVSNAIFVKVALSGVLIRNYSQNNLASFLPVQWPALALTST